MNFDTGQIQQLLSNVHFPIQKNDLVQQARQHGANDQITAVLERLPDQIFNSQQEVLNKVSGGLGNLGGGFKL